MSRAPLAGAVLDKLCTLSRLSVGSDAERAALTRDIGRILSHIETLAELDVSNVAPTTHAVDLQPRLRPDTVVDSLPVDTALGQAPERIGDGFGVPKIIE